MTERDIRDILRERPITVPQAFAPADRLHLLCPPETNAATFERAKLGFGPFSASVLIGFASVSIPARMAEAQDLWDLVMRDAMPADEHRDPGGEPLATIRTATLGWRLLALLGGSIELLTAATVGVQSWRASGQPTGLACELGTALLTFQSRGAGPTGRKLDAFAQPAQAADLFGYPSDEVLRRYVDPSDAEVIRARCERSAILIADTFSVTASVVANPFWRTFMKWKHGAIGTSPGVGPLWVRDQPDLDTMALDERLNTGIVVFDAQGGPKLYAWPTQRIDLVAYSQMTLQALEVAGLIVESVLRYVQPVEVWPIAIFEIEQAAGPTAAEIDAFGRLASSNFRVAGLAGLWRDPRH